MAGANIIEIISMLLDSLASKESLNPWEEKIAQSLACHGAIRAGQQLSNEEMRELIKQLEQTKQPRTCLHGRPTMIHLNSHQLEKELGRISQPSSFAGVINLGFASSTFSKILITELCF
jgi:DNA mismatch repair protein MutL